MDTLTQLLTKALEQGNNIGVLILAAVIIFDKYGPVLKAWLKGRPAETLSVQIRSLAEKFEGKMETMDDKLDAMAKSLQEQGAKQDKTHEMAIRHDEQILALSREIREFRRLCEDFRRSCQFKNHGKEGE